MPGVGALVFVAKGGPSEVEQMVAGGQHAAALDLLDRVLATGRCETVVVATDSPLFADLLRHLPVQIELDQGEFHFGHRLRALIEKHRIEKPLYFGGGSAPLLGQQELESLCDGLLRLDSGVIANNFYSADFVGFAPAEAIARVPLPAIDNDLAFVLSSQAGLPSFPLARSVSTQLDVDTPSDLAVLSVHPAVGPHLGQYLAALRLDTARLEAAMRCLVDSESEVLVAGRVSSQVWSCLEAEAACRKRVFSEERGMRASGREARREVVSLLGMHLEAVGVTRFFRSLDSLCQAAFLDTRVLFHHLRLYPSAPDRFHSDLLNAEAIKDPVLREFTAAAREAPVPVLMGGHSIVAGGLMALIEAAWARFDPDGILPRARRPAS